MYSTGKHACRPIMSHFRSRNVFIVFQLSSSFILLTVLTTETASWPSYSCPIQTSPLHNMTSRLIHDHFIHITYMWLLPESCVHWDIMCELALRAPVKINHGFSSVNSVPLEVKGKTNISLGRQRH